MMTRQSDRRRHPRSDVSWLVVVEAGKRRFLLQCRARTQVTGTRYGLSCLGSSGPLMLLLFVVGVMSLPWMIALALWIVVEKTAPWGRRIAGSPFDKG